MMNNPLLLAEYLKNGVQSRFQLSEDSSLESIVILIARFGLEYENYYEHLYNMIKSRNSFSLKLLKILEISLRSSKLNESTIYPFMKLFLRKSILGNPLEVCWLLGILINLTKRNESLRAFYGEEEGVDEVFNLDLEFEEVKNLHLKGFELITLRK